MEIKLNGNKTVAFDVERYLMHMVYTERINFDSTSEAMGRSRCSQDNAMDMCARYESLATLYVLFHHLQVKSVQRENEK